MGHSPPPERASTDELASLSAYRGLVSSRGTQDEWEMDRGRLKTRWLRATELFAIGSARPGPPAGRCLRQAVNVWARWRVGGADALHSHGPGGPAVMLSDVYIAAIEQALVTVRTHCHVLRSTYLLILPTECSLSRRMR
jgi:hypothetical protein